MSLEQPPHPGLILERDFMQPQGLSPATLAEKLGAPWTEEKIKGIIGGTQGVSDKSAHDLALFFKTSAEFWIDLQTHYFQWAKQKRELEQGPIKPKKSRRTKKSSSA